MPRRSKKPQTRPRFAAEGGDRPGSFRAMVGQGKEGGAVVTVLGDLDLAAAPELRKVMDEALDFGGEVEVDMRGCSFVDSTGIAVIVSGARQLAERGNYLRVKGAQDRVRKIFELAGLLENEWIKLDG